jgi:hypothetical protein
MAYCGVDELKEYLGVTGNGRTDVVDIACRCTAYHR